MAFIDPRLGGAERAEATPLWRRLAWMAGIWALSVGALGVVGLVLRGWLGG